MTDDTVQLANRLRLHALHMTSSILEIDMVLIL